MSRNHVCGAVLDEKTAKFKITYDGETYHFRSVTCKKRSMLSLHCASSFSPVVFLMKLNDRRDKECFNNRNYIKHRSPSRKKRRKQHWKPKRIQLKQQKN